MIKEAAKDIFFIEPPDGGNVCIIKTSDGLVMVDSGFLRHKNFVLKKMNQMDLDPKDICLGFISHPHCDHVGGMGWWREKYDFPVVANEIVAEPIETADPVITGTEFAYLDFDAEFYPCPIAEKTSSEDKTFHVGDKSFQVSHAPGHTIGSIHILCDEILFVGDTLFSNGAIGWIDVHWGSHPEDYAETLERMRKYCGNMVFAGHGKEYILGEDLIDKAKEIVSFYFNPEHGLGMPRVTSQYNRNAAK